MHKAYLAPHDKQIEERIIEYILLYGDEAEDVFLDLDFDYFYDPNLRLLIEIFYKMLMQNKKIDLISVNNEIENETFYKKLGGQTYLMKLTSSNGVLLGGGIKTWLNTLKELYQRREIMKQSRILHTYGMTSESLDNDVNKVFDSLSKILNEGESKITDMEDNIKILEESIKNNTETDLIGYSWGENFKWLDEHTGGLRKGKTYRIAGLSGAGKTSLVYQLIHNLIEQGLNVLFISLENNIETTLQKFLSSVQGVNPKDIEKGKIKPNTEYLREKKYNFKITDQLFGLNEIKREILKTKPDIVFLDYIGLVEIEGFTEETKYNKYADEIKQFLQKHKWFCMVDISNLGKGDTEDTIREHRGFNGSAKLRNNTDFGMHIFPYKPFEKYKTDCMKIGDSESKKNLYGKKVLTFFISKNRLGDDGIEIPYFIDFNKGIRFVEATEEQISLWNNLGN